MIQWPKNLSDPTYDPLVLGAIASKNFDHTFVPITINVGGHTGVFQVSQDALKIDGVRINASAILQQHIADLLGAYLITPKVMDQLWAQRSLTALPCTMPFNATSDGMIKHSACVDKQIVRPTSGIIQTVGKTWVLSNRISQTVACNMGWHLEKQIQGVPFDPAPTLPGAHMIQSPGFRHNPQHVDYSQIVLLIARDCVVDGQPTTFASVAQDISLSALVSGEGILHTLRQPGTPEMVSPPRVASKSPGVTTVAAVATGAASGAIVAGPIGAAIGGAVGWAADAVRRMLTS
jgi:hypothetical protein